MPDRVRRIRISALLVAALNSGATAAPAPSSSPTSSTTAPLPGASAGNVPNAPTQKIAAAALQEDARLLKRCFDAIHPGLYRYNTPAELDQRFAELLGTLSEDRTRAQAFVAFTRFAAAIRCGHTFANPYNQGESAMAELTAGRNRLPLRFRWIDRKMVVTGAATLKPGTEIVSINGTPASAILDAMLPLARADGSNDAKRVSQLELRGDDRYEIFDFLFPVLFPVDSDRFTIVVRTPGAQSTETVTVAGLTDEDRRAAHAERDAADKRGDSPLWMIDRRGDYAYLRMPTWVTYHSKWDWKGSIRSIFNELVEAGVPNLVIDLRGNEGGSPVGDEILARLISASVPWSDNERFVRYVKTPADLNAVLDTWDDSFRDRSTEVIGEVDLALRQPGLASGTTGGFFLLRETDESGKPVTEGMIDPVGPRYEGRVFVLVNADNSSATFSFAKAAQQLGVATIVGEPTGGNLRGINGGAYFFVRLPGSGLEVDLPQIGYYPKMGLREPRPDSGVIPDVPVRETADDVATGRDAALERVIDLMRKPK